MLKTSAGHFSNINFETYGPVLYKKHKERTHCGAELCSTRVCVVRHVEIEVGGTPREASHSSLEYLDF